jgi:hypothetical protein
MKLKPLYEYPVARVVDPASEAAVRAAQDRVRRAGVRLPRYLVHWVDAPAERDSLAQTIVSTSPFVDVYLGTDLTPAQTYAAMLHELQHVADHELARAGQTPAAELEQRAVRFAARMLEEETMEQHPSSTRAAIFAEGRRLASIAERAGRRFNASERQRARALLAELALPAPALPPVVAVPSPTPRRCLCSGYTFPLLPGSPVRRCGACQRTYFSP